MKILFITQWFDPEPILKGLAFARALRGRGHQVEVLTGFPNYPEGKLYDGYRIRLSDTEEIDGIRVHRVALFPSHDSSALRRIVNYSSFAISSGALGTLALSRPDLVYAYHPPATILLPALSFKLFRGVPFVLDVQDLWPDSLQATDMVRNRGALRLTDALCRLGYRAAARIVVLSPGFKRALVSRGVPEDKIEVIFNWYPKPTLSTPRDHSILEEAGMTGHFNVLFAGNMGKAQGLSTVLRAARIIATEGPTTQFILIGSGVEAQRLKEEAARLRLANVRFLPGRPAAEVDPLLSAADALLVHLRDVPLFRITIPSKTQAYLAAGRPVIMAVRGDAADIIASSGSGICVPPDDAEALSEAILQLSSLTPEERTAMGRRGRTYYEQNFTLEGGVDRLDALFQALGRAS